MSIERTVLHLRADADAPFVEAARQALHTVMLDYSTPVVARALAKSVAEFIVIMWPDHPEQQEALQQWFAEAVAEHLRNYVDPAHDL